MGNPIYMDGPYSEIAFTVATARYWEPAFDGLFSDRFVIDFINAAPGIPQHMDAFGVMVWKDWLRRTVNAWDVTLQELHHTPESHRYWAVGLIHAEVFWGGRDGVLDTKFIMEIVIRDGKVVYLKQMMDPLQFLKAAGREVPVFKMDLYDPEVEEFLQNAPSEEAAPSGDAELDTSSEAIAARKLSNLRAFTMGDYATECGAALTLAPGFENAVYFLPPEMKDYYPPEMIPRVEAWTVLSCPQLTFPKLGRYFPTEDPYLFFAEYATYGSTRWIGNHAEGHYQNYYFYLLRLDEYGRMTHWEEYLNSVNKFNSINVSIPSFPYYF